MLFTLYPSSGTAFISFVEIPSYADDNINEVIQLGYIINENDKLIKRKTQKENYTIKYDYDINLKNPLIIIPQDILNSQNKKCIIIYAEELIIKSNLSKENIQKTGTTSLYHSMYKIFDYQYQYYL